MKNKNININILILLVTFLSTMTYWLINMFTLHIWILLLIISLSLIGIRYCYFAFRNKEKTLLESLKLFFIKQIKWLFLTIVVFNIFIYYQNFLNPATASVFKLTNKTLDKDVIFIEMSHISNKDFFQSVENNVKKYSNEWYVLYYEGVELDISEEEVKDKLWIVPNKSTYELLSKSIWKNIETQDNTKIILSAKESVRSDVSFSELDKNKTFIKKENIIKESSEDIKEWLKILDEMKDNENKDIIKEKEWVDKDVEKLYNSFEKKSDITKQIYSYYIRWIFNFSTKNHKHMVKLSSYITKDNWFFGDKIINKRNDVLSQYIVNSDDNKIIVTYGKAHFEWLKKLLFENDSNWEIEEIQRHKIF